MIAAVASSPPDAHEPMSPAPTSVVVAGPIPKLPEAVGAPTPAPGCDRARAATTTTTSATTPSARTPATSQATRGRPDSSMVTSAGSARRAAAGTNRADGILLALSHQTTHPVPEGQSRM